MSLVHFYHLAESLGGELQRKLQTGTVTGEDVAVTDLALQRLEQEADQISLDATSRKERLAAEQFWLRVRLYRESMGLQTTESLSLVVESAIKH